MSIQVNTRSATETQSSFQLKGGLYTLTALQLLSSNFATFAAQLDGKIKQAPKFFQNAPIVIDLQKVNQPGVVLDFNRLKDTLLSRCLVAVGVKGGTAEQHTAAIAAGFAVLPESNKEREKPASTNDTYPNVLPSIPEEPEIEEIQGSNTRVITEPVRSGQQIYARGGDLIILAPVSHGSELLADGHIHVYGPLRGRALAGVTGDTSARIFCHSLEAELISIAGQYRISEDIEPIAWRIAADISLDDGGRLHIRAL
jgi:septum site-determining protein MinC